MLRVRFFMVHVPFPQTANGQATPVTYSASLVIEKAETTERITSKARAIFIQLIL